jgi:CO/xanthine dehydrogenase Mo-binding subunit
MIGWDQKYPFIEAGEHKVRSVGIAMAMQDSGIANVDVGSAIIKLSDGGFYTLMIGAADMGTGADTVLAQIAAERLECSIDDIVVNGVDTDQSPYDSGSYASSTTYVTGMAVVKTCDALRKQIVAEGAGILGCPLADTAFDGKTVYSVKGGKRLSLSDLANKTMDGAKCALTASESHSSPVSPPPFMVGAAEIELDLLTGKIDLIDYVAVVDCGTVINPNLARIQTEGGIVQGIGMALYEDTTYDQKGRMNNDSFLKYKIPTRQDVSTIRVEFESSFEPSGPFGAKSIGEVVISTPAPAIANAVYNATKVRIRTLPITGEKIVMGMLDLAKNK